MKKDCGDAAAIVREDVRSYISDGDIYPSVNSLEKTAEEMVQGTLKRVVDENPLSH